MPSNITTINNTTNNCYRKVTALIDSLIGHPQSNKHLADFLRGKGFARLNDFISSQRFNDSVMEDIMNRWEISLKRGGEVANLYYPE